MSLKQSTTQHANTMSIENPPFKESVLFQHLKTEAKFAPRNYQLIRDWMASLNIPWYLQVHKLIVIQFTQGCASDNRIRCPHNIVYVAKKICVQLLYKSCWWYTFGKFYKPLSYTPHNTVVGGGGGYIGFNPPVRPSVCPACRVRSVTPTVLGSLFPYWAQMLSSMTKCVAHNDRCPWPWPKSSRSFNHGAITLLKCGTSCRVRSTGLDGLFPYLAQMITSKERRVMNSGLCPRPISSRLFSHAFVVKLLKCGTSGCVHSITCTDLDGFGPYLAEMITRLKGCATQSLTLTNIFKFIYL